MVLCWFPPLFLFVWLTSHPFSFFLTWATATLSPTFFFDKRGTYRCHPGLHCAGSCHFYLCTRCCGAHLVSWRSAGATVHFPGFIQSCRVPQNPNFWNNYLLLLSKILLFLQGFWLNSTLTLWKLKGSDCTLLTLKSPTFSLETRVVLITPLMRCTIYFSPGSYNFQGLGCDLRGQWNAVNCASWTVFSP
jgi:hypothetical protein